MAKHITQEERARQKAERRPRPPLALWQRGRDIVEAAREKQRLYVMAEQGQFDG